MNSRLKTPLWVLCCLLISVSPVLAQKGGGAGSGGGSGSGSGGGGKGGSGPINTPGPPSSGPVFGSPNFGSMTNPGPWGLCGGAWSCPTTTPRPMPATPTQHESTCFLPPVEGIHNPTVSVIRLEVPGKATREYQKACSEVHHKKYDKAEEHLQRAIDSYSSYTAAWVLLGQIQEVAQKTDQAGESCNRARRIDSNYAPAYLCLAHLAAAESKWKEVADITDHLLRLHPLNASNAYYYNALANLRLNNLSLAETSALRGVEDTKKSHQPELHLLLAQIYEKKGDRNAEVAELQEYVKRAPHSSHAAQINQALSVIAKETPAGQH